jgi:magnesium transporter
LSSSLLKSDELAEADKERLRIIFRDVNSLLQHTQFSFERLEYLQNTFLGLVNIEQNTVIKIFTVVTVVFMPPTLIASVYGMNFDFMPELKWPFGYPFAIFLMISSSLVFLWYFKRKKWL